MAQDVPAEKTVSLKALVDKESNKVIFVEADNDFIDVLFSFLTLPMGRIVRLARDHTTPLEIGEGCMNKLYQAIEKLDEQDFRSNGCRDMLLHPRSLADPYCKNLKLKIIDDAEPTQYFTCYTPSPVRSVSYYKDVHCPNCSTPMQQQGYLRMKKSQVGGVFVKVRSRVIITDDLQVIPPFSAASICLFTKLGDVNTNRYEEQIFCIGVEQVLDLLVRSLVSKTPFTETLLKNYPVPKFSDVNFSPWKCIESQTFEDSTNEEKENISIKLIVSKSKNVVCYAEVREDFVNLLFSFLTLPFGFILKKILDFPWKGCTDHLLKGVQDFDEDFFLSNHQKELLCSPKLVPGFSYENKFIGIEEAVYYYYYDCGNRQLATDKSIFPLDAVNVKFMDPKSHCDEDNSARGFLQGPAVFTVTDKLDVRPVSPTFQFSVLNELKVPFTDIEGRTVLIGKKEALGLLVSSFVSDSVLTNVFLRKPTEPAVKQEQ